MFRKGWESNENGCLDTVMKEFSSGREKVKPVTELETVE